MRKAWNVFIAIAALCNAVDTAHSWYVGQPATTWIWVAAILFSVGVMFQCLSGAFVQKSTL